MRKFFAFLAGAICGGLVGAVAALLFTPVSGDELRRLLQERVEMVMEEGRRAAEQRRAELEAQFAAARGRQA